METEDKHTMWKKLAGGLEYNGTFNKF